MPGRSPASETPEWILQPPSAGSIHMHFAAGSEVELSPEARAALEQLLGVLQEGEVGGFARAGSCTSLNDCTDYSCVLERCQPLTKLPCAFRLDCVVADVRL